MGNSAKNTRGSASSENVASLSGKWEGEFSNGLQGATAIRYELHANLMAILHKNFPHEH